MTEQRTIEQKRTVKRVMAWVVLIVSGALIILAMGAKFGWGTPLLVLFALGFTWALHEVMT